MAKHKRGRQRTRRYYNPEETPLPSRKEYPKVEAKVAVMSRQLRRALARQESRNG